MSAIKSKKVDSGIGPHWNCRLGERTFVVLNSSLQTDTLKKKRPRSALHVLDCSLHNN